MEKRLTIAFVMIVIAITCGQFALAQDFRINDDENELYLWPSYSFLYAAPVAYYKVFGVWPETWQAVEEAGLCQVAIREPEGLIVDPDDGEWNFMGDMAYQFQGTETPLIQMCIDWDGMKIDSQPVGDPGMTYRYWLSEFTQDPASWEYLNDREDVLIMIALKRMLHHSIGDYMKVYGDVPDSWDALIASGISMLDKESVNPMTGGALYGDGRPNDFLYEYQDAGHYDLQVTDENGETTWRGLMEF